MPETEICTIRGESLILQYHMRYIILITGLMIFELLYIAAARRVPWLNQQPGAHSSHDRPTPTAGGLIFYIAVMAAYIASGTDYTLMAGGISLVAGVSLSDDLRPLPVTLSVALRLPIYLGGAWLILRQLGFTEPWQAVVPVLIIAAGWLNAYNFMDGINGITAAYSVVVLGSLGWLNSRIGFADPALIWMSMGAVGVFAVFNFRRRALCFAGDVGAITMGAITLYLAGALIAATGRWEWVVLGAVYGVDTVLTIARRLRLGERIWTAHRRHLYQLLCNEAGLPHTTVAAIYALIQAAVSTGAILLPTAALSIYTVAVTAILVITWTVAVKAIISRGRE